MVLGSIAVAWAFSGLASRKALNGTQVALAVFIGVLIHIPVAALFVVPYLRSRGTPDAGRAVTR